jgi:hypothetical protein
VLCGPRRGVLECHSLGTPFEPARVFILGRVTTADECSGEAWYRMFPGANRFRLFLRTFAELNVSAAATRVVYQFEVLPPLARIR